MQVHETGKFNQLPQKAQVLWCHLAANAGEDGIVENAREIRHALGVDGEAVRALLNAGFVKTTESGRVYMEFGGCAPPRFLRINGDLYVYAADVTAMPHGLWHPGWVQV